MNKKTKLIIFFAVVMVLIYTFVRNEKPKTKTATEFKVINEENYLGSSTILLDGVYIAKEGAVIHWDGRNPLLENFINRGELKIKSAQLESKNNEATGNITFDMNSITTTSTAMGSGFTSLDEHLKGVDFFDTDHYGESQLKILGITDGILYGELTIKDVTREISLPVHVSYNQNDLNISGKTKIDRTLWGIQYASKKFSANIKENLIDDYFGVEFSLDLSPEETTVINEEAEAEPIF